MIILSSLQVSAVLARSGVVGCCRGYPCVNPDLPDVGEVKLYNVPFKYGDTYNPVTIYKVLPGYTTGGYAEFLDLPTDGHCLKQATTCRSCRAQPAY
jgi:hypothetical protein